LRTISQSTYRPSPTKA
jgi:hypothetical protein